MHRTSRKYYLFLFSLLWFLPASVCTGQPQVYRDSIRIILNKPAPNASEIDQLNKLLLTAWNKFPGTNSLLDDAILILDAARKNGHDTLVADAMINLVKIYLLKYESSKSLEYALEAYKIYEAADNHDKMAYTLLQIGLVYYTQNNFHKSLEYYNNAVNEYEKSGNKTFIATLFYLSGINYSKLKNFSSAQMFFNRALKLKKELNDEQGIAECNMGIAELFISQNLPDSAIHFLNLTSEYTEKTSNLYGSSKAKILLGEALNQKKQYKEAKEAVLEGIKLAEKTHAKELVIDGKNNLYKLSAAAEDYKSAYFYLQDYLTLRDSVINDKTSKNISRLEADYVLNKKQNEILLLENQNRSRTLMLRGSVIIIILAIMLALLFYNKQQLKQKANFKLEQAYKELENTQNQLIQQEKLASLGQLTAGIAHEIKNPLNFVTNFSNVSIELINELRNADSEEEKSEILEDIQMNLERIASHGERANSIITRMLDHSRSGEREMQKSDLNKLINEYYTLAYQAMRINIPGFSCNLKMQLDQTLPEVNMVTQEISRVLLNIFNNSLYALSHNEQETGSKAELSVSSRYEGGKVIVNISDNGPGIPQSILDKIFQPFFTTKPSGQGTGLGLSLSHDIIVAHGGTIKAGNKPEGGAEFIITLPV